MKTSTSLSIAFLFLAPAVSAQTLQFQPRADFDYAAEFPKQMALADFDHDGNLDLVTTNFGNGGGRIDVKFGNGNSDFSANFEIPLDSAEAIGLGDFDGDGWIDIAAGITVVWHQDVHIFHNDHNRSFTAAGVLYPLAYGPMGIATADFDNDGKLDIAIASTSSSYALTWFPGNGNMTFGAGIVVPSTSQDSALRLITADFNNDGKPDLAMSRTNGARVFLNPLPGFQFQNSFDLPVSYNITGIVAADVDGDGVLDLLTQSTANHFGVWHGAGDGTFTQLHDYTITGNSTDLRVGDINNDGQLDVLIPTFSGIQLYLGLGSGAFGAAQTVATGVQPMAGALGDWNGDGALDLAVACSNGGGQAYLSIHEQIPPPPITILCQPGTGGTSACPCANPPSGLGRGCDNSSTSGGAILAASGNASLAADTLVFTTSAEKPTATSIVVQGNTLNAAGSTFGQGVRCAAGTLHRLYVKTAVSGSISAPGAGDAHVAARSATLGDTLAQGAHRYYGVYYRDPGVLGGCAATSTFNMTQQLDVLWRN